MCVRESSVHFLPHIAIAKVNGCSHRADVQQGKHSLVLFSFLLGTHSSFLLGTHNYFLTHHTYFGTQGVVRVENLEDATEHVPTVLERVKPEYLVGRFA